MCRPDDYAEYDLPEITTSRSVTVVSLNAANLSNGVYRIDYSHEIQTDAHKALAVVTVAVNNNIISESNSPSSTEQKGTRFLLKCGFKEMNLSGNAIIVMNLKNDGKRGDVSIRRCRISLYRVS